MRRIWLQLAIAGIAALVPSAVWADGQEIAKQIGQNLKTSGALSGYNIGVKVEGSTATLNGTVTSAKQMDDALRIAEQTPGIEKFETTCVYKLQQTIHQLAMLVCVNRRVCSTTVVFSKQLTPHRACLLLNNKWRWLSIHSNMLRRLSNMLQLHDH